MLSRTGQNYVKVMTDDSIMKNSMKHKIFYRNIYLTHPTSRSSDNFLRKRLTGGKAIEKIKLIHNLQWTLKLALCKNGMGCNKQ